MKSDSTLSSLPYRNRLYKIWWREFISGRVHKFGQPVLWDGYQWYYNEGDGHRTYLALAIQWGVVRWEFAHAKKGTR